MFLRSFVSFGVLLGVSVGAHADELFNLTDGANVVTFRLPDSVASPQVNYNDGYLAQVPGVSVDVNGTVINNENVDLSYTDNFGGLAIYNQTNSAAVLIQSGPQLFTGAYTGSDSTLTFLPGKYNLNQELDAEFNSNFTLSIAATAPEPSSIALLGTGLLGVAGVMKRRFV